MLILTSTIKYLKTQIKAALDHFTRTMATNLMFEGVKVNSVNPATVRTDIHYSKGLVGWDSNFR